MDSEPIVIEAVPVTDLVLVVGPGKEPIPVESAILKAASPVFASMLSPPWLESQSKEIVLPEDDADAMEFITLTLSYHNEYEFVTRPRTPQEILQIAIAADKYDLRTALKFVLDFLFREASKTCPVAKNLDGSQTAMAGEDIVYLCAAAYILNRCEHFSKFGLDLMCRHASSFTTLMNDELISSILPAKFFVMLGEKVTLFQLGLFRAVQECVISDSPYRHCHCDWSRSFVKRLEGFTLNYGGHNEPEIGSVLLREMNTMQDFLHEDKSFIKGYCLMKGEPHSQTVEDDETLSFKVQTASEEFNVIFCICELRNRDGCNAKHARLMTD